MCCFSGGSALATAKNHDTNHVGSIGVDPIGCEVLCCVVLCTAAERVATVGVDNQGSDTGRQNSQLSPQDGPGF